MSDIPTKILEIKIITSSLTYFEKISIIKLVERQKTITENIIFVVTS